MVERKTPGEIILLVFIYAAVTLVGFVCLYPMLYCLAASRDRLPILINLSPDVA